MYICCSVTKLCLTLLRPHGLQLARFLCPGDFPSKNTGVGCHFLLQGLFLTQGSTHISCTGRFFATELPRKPIYSIQPPPKSRYRSCINLPNSLVSFGNYILPSTSPPPTLWSVLLLLLFFFLAFSACHMIGIRHLSIAPFT